MEPLFNYDFKEVSPETQKALYFNMLKSRLIEDKMLILLRQGKISKWFSGIGQEAISVGVTLALNFLRFLPKNNIRVGGRGFQLSFGHLPRNLH